MKGTNSGIALLEMAVVKRNGALEPFHRGRIHKAISSAFLDVKGQVDFSLEQEIENLTEQVEKECYEIYQRGDVPTVEGIQDIVEVVLMKQNHHDVAKSYILYRNEHKKHREQRIGNIRIYRRDGAAAVRFNPMKITAAIQKLFIHSPEAESSDNLSKVAKIVIDRVLEEHSSGKELSIEDVEEFIEQALMQEGYFTQAKHYILKRVGAVDTLKKEPLLGQQFLIKTKDGSRRTIHQELIRKRIAYATRGFEHIASVDGLVEETIQSFYGEMTEEEMSQAMILVTRAKVEIDPCYSFIAARLLLDTLYQETLEISAMDPTLAKKEKDYFPSYIRKGVSLGRLSTELLHFDLSKLADALDSSRDLQFRYLGLQTLYDRYFIHDEGRRLETPQIFWMRVAMGLALNEPQREARAIEFYHILSEFYFVSSTPTLFNSGTGRSQLSSCYLSTTMDDLEGIFKVISDDARLSKWAGGLGNDWTNVRATGSRIHGTNGQSQGVIPFLKVANDVAVAVNQGGKRKGAICAYLEVWHLDIEDFIELRKNTGDERRRTHDMNTASWIPDLFMKRVLEGKMWTLFSPSDVPDLHDLYGEAFEKAYLIYEEKARQGEIPLFKEVEAVALWRKMLGMLFETGHPWITFKDPSNIRSPQDHAGVVHSSNLCTEILLNTSQDETAVCNLGSINLEKHIVNGSLDTALLEKTVSTAVRMLDNVIDINFYPIEEAKQANLRHRPVGLGLMGFQDSLYKLGLSYASHEAILFADESMEWISYFAILASTQLAQERGVYSSYKGSKWDRGLLPIDTISLLEKERGVSIEQDRVSRLDWSVVRRAIKEHGMRNSNLMAIAPTATIANIIGVTQSIEPTFKNIFVKSNLSGEFTVPNVYLVDRLKELGLWDQEMLDDLKYHDGSLLEIERVPVEVKKLFLTAFEISPEWIIEAASRRQKWIDMGQSLNLYIDEPSGKKLHEMYFQAWSKGLKTCYYLRSRSATQIEKSTTDINRRGIQPKWMKSVSASSKIKVERSLSCSLEEGCESCQ